eukprot:8634-Heterococcus_DN1.PRE.2
MLLPLQLKPSHTWHLLVTQHEVCLFNRGRRSYEIQASESLTQAVASGSRKRADSQAVAGAQHEQDLRDQAVASSAAYEARADAAILSCFLQAQQLEAPVLLLTELYP